jgi:glutamate N-acetyltransferase/amino-acid N-acetyltransferase
VPLRLGQEIQEVLRRNGVSQPRVEGFAAAGICCGLKASGALDLAVIASDRPARAAGVYTRNRFPGAPVMVSRQHIRGGAARGVVANSRISNVATGRQGMADAREMARLLARELGARPREIQVASTGVIGWPLPMDKLRAGIPAAVRRLSPAGWGRAARAIMTTDTVPKLAVRRIGGASLVGIAKGAAMCMPNMATMLSFIATDLPVELELLRASLREAVASSFNALSIDGETSTSDMVVLLANGAAGGHALAPGSARARAFGRALGELCGELAEKLAADGEGVTKLAEVVVRGARNAAQADAVARKIANSVLVKTALFGADPNWGRIVQAVGCCGVPLRPAQIDVTLGGVAVLRAGEPIGGAAALARARRALQRKRSRIEVGVGSGPGEARLLTTDLTYDYVRINAEYTT